MSVLSKSNIDKLCMSGIYRCEPMLEKLPSYKRDTPYWSNNWTFKVEKVDGEYYMYDTYWSDGFCILLTDENFDKFEFVFDSNEVEIYRGNNWSDYDDNDKWIISLDSGGGTMPKKVIRRSAKPVKQRVINRLTDEIKNLESQIELKKRNLVNVEMDKVDLRYV